LIEDLEDEAFANEIVYQQGFEKKPKCNIPLITLIHTKNK